MNPTQEHLNIFSNVNRHKRKIDSNTIVEDFSIPLTSIETLSRQKTNKETQALNDKLEQIDLIDIYRAFRSKSEEYIFFSSAYGTFSRVDHMLGHKGSLVQFKKTEAISSIFSNHSAIGLEVNYKKKQQKPQTHRG